jgi:DNA modification methylase
VKKEHITLRLDEIVPYENNPRVNDQAVPAVMESIQQCTYINDIIVDEANVILAGHTRYKALQRLGYTEVEVCRVTGLTEEQKRKYRLLDNKTGELAEWDMEKLEQELEGLDFGDFDFEFHLEGDAEPENVMEDEPPEVDEESAPFTQRGDIYLLGNHRLMCGDSTVAEDMAVLLEGKRVEMVFTDPPWNVNYGATDHPSWKQRTIQNDYMSEEAFRKFLANAFSCMADVLVPGGMAYVVMSAQEWGSLMPALSESGFHWSSTIIWNKDRLVLSRKDYHTRYEPIWYGWKDDAPRIRPLTDRGQCDVWDIPRPSKSEEHPTMKPVALVARAILNSSRTDAAVLDQFGGSGTTLIACAQTGRTSYTMELDPKYVDVIVKRYIALIGNAEQVFLKRDGIKTRLPDSWINGV